MHGMKTSQRWVDQLAYWVVSDQFEELGRPDAFPHGGFGLLTIGNLRKPRYLALQLACSPTRRSATSMRSCAQPLDRALWYALDIVY